jgi:hypothetical protein
MDLIMTPLNARSVIQIGTLRSPKAHQRQNRPVKTVSAKARAQRKTRAVDRDTEQSGVSVESVSAHADKASPNFDAKVGK